MAIELNNTIVPGRDNIASAKFFARIFGLGIDEAEVGCDRSHTRSVEKLGIGMTPWQVANALGAAARLAQQGRMVS